MHVPALHPADQYKNFWVVSFWDASLIFSIDLYFIQQKYTPKGDGSCGSVTPTVARYDSMVVWNCEKGAELVNVGAIQV